MTIPIIIVSVLVLLILVYGAIFSKNYTVSVTEEFNVEAPKIFEAIIDLKTWEKWSPWIMHDPENVELKYSSNPAVNEEGGHYSWKSKRLGEGTLTNVSLIKPTLVEQKINFVKPFKSTTKTSWKLEYKGETTAVTWSMTGSMPFFMRWLTSRMKVFLSNDFRTGLLMLRRMLDPEAPKWHMKFNEIVEQPKFDCIGKVYKGKMDQAMKDEIGENFSTLPQFAQEDGSSTYLTLCTEMSESKKTITLYYGVAPAPSSGAPEGFVKFEIPKGKYLKSTYTGDYEYISLAWHHAAGSIRMNKKKFGYPRKPYELYVVGAGHTENKDEYVTELYMPVK